MTTQCPLCGLLTFAEMRGKDLVWRCDDCHMTWDTEDLFELPTINHTLVIREQGRPKIVEIKEVEDVS